MIYLA